MWLRGGNIRRIHARPVVKQEGDPRDVLSSQEEPGGQAIFESAILSYLREKTVTHQ